MRTTHGNGWAIALVLISGAIAPAARGDGAIPGIVTKGEVVRVQTGFVFTEGPTADADGNVYFTDVRANKILKLDTKGNLSTFLEESQGANGLGFDGKGRLIVAQGVRARIVAIDVATRQITVLADKCDGKPLVRPNDLVVDRQGGVYFTDPDPQSVYYVAADGRVSRLIDDLPRPNGVILSPDEATLYVVPSGSARRAGLSRRSAGQDRRRPGARPAGAGRVRPGAAATAWPWIVRGTSTWRCRR